jgi:hypothetical protein
MKNQIISRPTENWTKYPNSILDNLEKLKPMEVKVISFMIRKNIGYDEPSLMFSVSYLAKKLGHNRGAIMNALNGLIKKKSVVVVEEGKQGIRSFDINWQDPLKNQTGKKIEPVQKSNRSTEPTGKKIEPVPVRKSNQSTGKKIEPSTRKQLLQENTTTTKQAKPSPPSFFKNISDLFPDDVIITKKRYQEIIRYAESNSIDYVERQIAYTDAKCDNRNSFFAFCIKACKDDWAAGYNPDTVKIADRDAQRIADKAAESDRKASKRAKASQDKASKEKRREDDEIEQAAKIINGLKKSDRKRLVDILLKTAPNVYTKKLLNKYKIKPLSSFVSSQFIRPLLIETQKQILQITQ